MRKSYVYIALAAAALTGFTACSDSDDIANGGTTSGEGATSYISVNIMNPESTPAGAKSNGLTRVAGYENGTPDEGKVSNVRFYFFNQDGSPYILTNSVPAGVNWLNRTITSTTEQNNDPTTVERVTNAMLVIQGASGATPAYMCAVVNPTALTKPDATSSLPDNVLDDRILSRDELTSSAMQTRTFSGNDGFLMTNSVYMDNGTYRCATPTSGHVDSTEAKALANPVDIYVERLAAKVTVAHSADSKWSTRTVNGNTLTVYPVDTVDNKVVYAAIKGVGLSDEQRFGKTFKDLGNYSTSNSSSVADELGINPWSTADYHRSFWEVSPDYNALSSDNPIDYKFTDYTSGFYSDATSNQGVFYTMPSTPTLAQIQTADAANRNSERTYRTKVLIAAQLMMEDANGNLQPAEICTYRGNEYIGENAVKDAILNELKNRLTIKDGNSFRDLERTDITFRVPNETEYSTYKSYEVIPELAARDGQFALTSTTDANNQLAAGQTVRTYSPSDNDGNTPELDAVFYAYANKAQIRHEGDTYYYTTIRHLAENESKLGYFGVVRNHWYQVTVNSLRGFGTPVYDPDRAIVPVTPTDQSTYLAARINVLQWRVVPQTVDIDGTTKK